MRIYLDRASIHNDILKRYPGMDPDRSSCYESRSTSSAWFIVSDFTGLSEGVEIEIASTEHVDYHGISVDIVRWKAKS